MEASMNYRWVLAVLSAMACLLQAGQAWAQSGDSELRQRIEELETEVGELRRQCTTALEQSQCIKPMEVHPTPCLKGCSSTYTVKVGGFFQTDWGWFHQDAANIARVGDVQDGAGFRRARVSVSGDAWQNIGYFMEYDFAFPGRPSFMDVYFDVRQTQLGTLRFGHWRQPFGMDGLTSVKELTFLERALPFAFLPFRQIGLGIFDQAYDETMTYALSGFRYPTDTFGNNIGDNGGYAMAGRLTFAPWLSDNGSRLVHVGGAYSFLDPASDVVRYRNQPEFFISETGGANLVPAGVPTAVPPFVDTGPISTHNVNLFAAEGGLVMGSLYMQSEAIYAVVNQIGGRTLSFGGAYAYAGYFLTGEVRPYNRRNGVFGRVKPLRNAGACGWGAWELAGRWSYIDLNDANIVGRRLNDLTAGINWYLNPRTKVQFNYIHAFLVDPVTAESNANVFALRGQVDF